MRKSLSSGCTDGRHRRRQDSPRHHSAANDHNDRLLSSATVGGPFWGARSGAICEIAASSPSGFAAQFIAVRRSSSYFVAIRRFLSVDKLPQLIKRLASGRNDLCAGRPRVSLLPRIGAAKGDWRRGAHGNLRRIAPLVSLALIPPIVSHARCQACCRRSTHGETVLRNRDFILRRAPVQLSNGAHAASWVAERPVKSAVSSSTLLRIHKERRLRKSLVVFEVDMEKL